MLIANPIYDAIFKYLMEDTDIAKKLIGLIIDEEILALELKPQEQTHFSVEHMILVFRMDFKATIRTATGASKQILIELQKSGHIYDIMRFRKYLGENYTREEEILLDNGEKIKIFLPIITIYFLGFSLENVAAKVLKVNRSYVDVLTRQELQVKNEFIEKLTHDCFVIQIPKLTAKWQSRLEKILAVFNQHAMAEDRHMLNVDESGFDDPLFKQIADRLGRAALTPELRQQAEFEDEIENKLDLMARKVQMRDDAIIEKERQLAESERQLAEKDRQIAELMEKLRSKA